MIYFAFQHRPGFNLKLEIFQCLVLGGVLMWFAFMGGYVSDLRSRTRRSEALYRTTWETATEELCQNRPFIASIDFVDGDNHSVVVTGYSVTKGVRLYDPLLDGFVWEKRADFFEGQSLDYERIRDTYKIQPTQ